MGMYSPDLPLTGLGNDRFRFPDVVKRNCIFREQRVSPREYAYRYLIALWCVVEVKSALRRLHSLR
jgi:hypothetical protein